jgi:hypothetical protein
VAGGEGPPLRRTSLGSTRSRRRRIDRAKKLILIGYFIAGVPLAIVLLLQVTQLWVGGDDVATVIVLQVLGVCVLASAVTLAVGSILGAITLLGMPAMRRVGNLIWAASGLLASAAEVVLLWRTVLR